MTTRRPVCLTARPPRRAFGFRAAGRLAPLLGRKRADCASVLIARATDAGGRPHEHEPQTPQFVASSHRESERDDAEESIRRGRANRRLRAALLKGTRSPVAGDADDDYFASLRKSAETGI